MRLYWGDYSRKTRHLKKAAEHGAYLLLIGALWDAGGKLPADDETLADHALLTPKEWAGMKARIMPFFKVSRGMLTQTRVTEELAKFRDTSGKRKMAGKAGGSASAGKLALNPEANAKQMPTQSESKKERTPSPQGGEVDLKRFSKALAVTADAGCGFDLMVDRIHKAQPVVEGKRRSTAPDVQRALGGALKRGGSPSAIWSAVQAYYALPASTKDGGQFAHGAAVVLNKDRWKEFLAPAAEAGHGNSAGPAPTFNAPAVRASIVQATDEDFARSYVDHYCRWVPTGRRLEATKPAVVAILTGKLSAWAKAKDVTIALMSANDAPALFGDEAAA